MKKNLLLLVALLFSVFLTDAQRISTRDAADFIVKNKTAAGLTAYELSNFTVSNAYVNEGTQMFYLNQSFHGVPVFNQLKVLAFKNGNVISDAGYFLKDPEKLSRNATSTPGISAENAVMTALANEKLPVPVFLKEVAATENAFKKDFGILPGVTERVTAQLLWIPLEINKQTVLKLAWQIQVAPVNSDWWLINVDAISGTVIDKISLTVKDNWGHDEGMNNISAQNTKATHFGIPFLNVAASSQSPASPAIVNGASYLVIPYPAESPVHPGGTAAVRTDPWTMTPGNATTLKWHSDGTTDYNITRGNNVWATEDRAGTNTNSGIAPLSTTPDPLTFNFTPDYGISPTTSNFQKFTTTNLFYWNNLMHDMSYQYGFNEVSANFQKNNLSRGGNQNDDVIALSQSGAGNNNADFSTPADGSRPRMRMFLFDAKGSNIILKVNTPLSIAGNYTAVESSFGNLLTNVPANNLLQNVGPVTAQAVYFTDPSGTHEACTTSAGSVTGKIAVIDRGSCNFTVKVKAAQDAGAVAVIVVNNVAGAPTIMGTTGNTGDFTITIPAVMISQSDGAILAAQIANNLNITLSGIRFDGDLDAGIISHEYGHGISHRLTGGGSNTTCLGRQQTNANDPCTNIKENGDEGWSDYFGLMITTNWGTAQLTDGSLSRSVGTYVYGQTPAGAGIRIKPYSTNLTVNPETYANVGDATYCGEIHNLGEIWCTMIWEMTWAIIQQQGAINTDLFNFSSSTAGGNSIALKLVTEGLRLQPCNPGFVDQRNFILTADRNLYNGTHACAIWTAFAKRGLGYSASQGSALSVTDQVAASDMPPAPPITTQPLDVSVAAGGTANFIVASSLTTNVIYNWQVSTDGGTIWNNVSPAVITPTLSLTSVTCAMNGYKYRSVLSIGCASTTSAAVTLTVTGCSTAPTITTQPAGTSACVGGNATFTVAATGGTLTYSWEVSTNGGGSWAPVSPAVTTPTLTLTGVTAAMNNNQYRVVVSNGTGSTTSTAATLTVNAVPAAPAVTTPVAYCQNATATALTATGTGLLWYTAATGGTGNSTAPIPSTATVGSTIYYVSQTTTGCESPRAQITVNVTATPAAPTVTTPVNYCQNQAATALTATGTNLKWYTVATGGTALPGAPTPSTATVGTTTYYVSQTTGTCEGPRASIVVNVTATTPAPAVTTPVTYCQNATATPLTATGTGLLWYTAATGGVGSSTAPTPSTTTVGSTTYYVSQTTSCGESPRAAIVVNVNAIPAAPTATTPVTYCQNATATPLTATGTGLLWYTVSTGGTGSATAITPSTTTVGSTTYYVSQTTSGCESPRTAIVVTINAIPAAPTATSPVTYCQNATATPLTATGTGFLWYTAATGGTGSATAITPSTTTVGSTIYYVSQTTSGCESPRTAITVNVTAATSITTQPTAVTTCSGTNTSFTVVAAGTNLTYQWQLSTTGCAGTFTNITGATTATLSLTGVTLAMNGNAYKVVVTGTCAPLTVTSSCVLLTVNSSTTVTGNPADLTRCVGTSATFTAAATGGTISYQWQVSTDGGNVYQNIAGETNASYTIASVTAVMNGNKYRAAVTSTCTAAGLTTTAATLTVQSTPAITAQPTDITSCTTSATFTVTATGTGIVYQWQLSTDGGTTFTNIPGATSSTLTVNNLTTAMSNFRYRVVISTTSCGTVTSNSVTAKVGTNPVVVLTLGSVSATNPTQPSGLYTTVSPVGNYVYQWKRDGVVLPVLTSSITAANGLLDAFGTYTVSVFDVATGCSGTSNSITISDIAGERDRLFIFPNPTYGKVDISFYSSIVTTQARTVIVYDDKGSRMMTKGFSPTGNYGKMTLDLTGLTKGVYLIELRDAAGKKLASDKVIKL